MSSNDLVRVICVARSCYDISVSDEIVIGLGFEITAFDEFVVDCSARNSSAKVSACDNAMIVDGYCLIKGTSCYL